MTLAIHPNSLLRSLLLLPLASTLLSCVSYEPAVLIPAVTLSPETLSLREPGAETGARADFGLDVSVNESDSLFNVEVLPGVLVRELTQLGPAASAGLRVGDVILAIDGTEVNQPDAIRALEQTASVDDDYEFRVRRGTTVFAATLSPRQVGDAAPPRELYRLDPLASRAGYRSRVIEVTGGNSQVAAEVVSFSPGSPLPGAGIAIGDLIVALEGGQLSSAQDLVSRLNQQYELGERVALTVYDGATLRDVEVELWDPGRRISRVALGPLLHYDSELNPPSQELTLIDLWLFSVYRYRQSEGERSHSILGLLNFTSDYGELVEE